MEKHLGFNENRKGDGRDLITRTTFVESHMKNQRERDSPACDSEYDVVNKKWKSGKTEAPVENIFEKLDEVRQVFVKDSRSLDEKENDFTRRALLGLSDFLKDEKCILPVFKSPMEKHDFIKKTLLELSDFPRDENCTLAVFESPVEKHQGFNENRKGDGRDPITRTTFFESHMKNQRERDSSACDSEYDTVNKKWKSGKTEAPVENIFEKLDEVQQAFVKDSRNLDEKENDFTRRALLELSDFLRNEKCTVPVFESPAEKHQGVNENGKGDRRDPITRTMFVESHTKNQRERDSPACDSEYDAVNKKWKSEAPMGNIFKKLDEVRQVFVKDSRSLDEKENDFTRRALLELSYFLRNEKCTLPVFESPLEKHNGCSENRKRDGRDPITQTTFFESHMKNQRERDSPPCDSEYDAVSKKWKSGKTKAPMEDTFVKLGEVRELFVKDSRKTEEKEIDFTRRALLELSDFLSNEKSTLLFKLNDKKNHPNVNEIRQGDGKEPISLIKFAESQIKNQRVLDCLAPFAESCVVRARKPDEVNQSPSDVNFTQSQMKNQRVLDSPDSVAKYCDDKTRKLDEVEQSQDDINFAESLKKKQRVLDSPDSVAECCIVYIMKPDDAKWITLNTAWDYMENLDEVKKIEVVDGLYPYSPPKQVIQKLYFDDEVRKKINEQLHSSPNNCYLKYLESLWFSDAMVDDFLGILGQLFPDCYFYGIFLARVSIRNYPVKGFNVQSRHNEKHRKIFLPMCVKKHFFGLCADQKRKNIYIFDSLDGYLKNHKPLICLLTKLLSIDAEQYEIINFNDIPRQTDSSSCGIFLCKYFEYFAREEQIPFDQGTVGIARSILLYELENKRILRGGSILGIKPSKKLLILDVNGILAEIVWSCGKSTATERPFCRDFLKFCFENFEVAIWTSRTEKNFRCVMKDMGLFTEIKESLFIWYYEHCTKIGKVFGSSSKPALFKELKNVWTIHTQYDASNTLLVDDSPYKAFFNPACTAIFPHSYRSKGEFDNCVGPGGKIRVYLENLVEADHVQDYVRQNPFSDGQKAIKENSEEWEYYHQMCRNNWRNPLLNFTT